MPWPPTLDALKLDLKIEPEDTRDDDRLRQVLNAAVGFVERVRKDGYNFAEDLGSSLPDPAKDSSLQLGTIRLAGRWHTRRRSPDALIDMGEMGNARVPSIDPDIERLLRIGRHAVPAVG